MAFPSTPVLDDFNRDDEDPLGQTADDFYAPAIEPSGGSWAALNTREWNSLAATEFDSANSEDWNPAGEGQSSNISIIEDATAPLSASNVLRSTYPEGYEDGTSPTFPGPQLTAPFDADDYRAIYYRAAVKPSAGFEGQNSSITKLSHIWVRGGGAGSGSNDFYIRLSGTGANTLTLAVNTQNRLGGARTWTRNVGSAGDDEVVRGEWNLIEVLIQLESAVGVADAIVQAAVNGVQIIDVSNEQFLDTGDDDVVFEMLTLDRTWGGEDGQTVQAEFYYDEDHTIVMGGP